MALHEPEWTLWRSFRAVMREGSLSAAARTLQLTQPTVGRHIGELESALQTALFTRSPSGLAPTATAIELGPRAEAMADTAAALVRIASGEADQMRGAIRITTSEVIGAEVLPAMVGTFRDRHPATAIELVLSNQTEDLLSRQADIAIRMVRPTQSALVARRIGHVTLGLHAHRRYIAAHGMPESVADFDRHTFIGFDSDTASIRALRSIGLSVDRESFAVRTDSDLAQLAAIRAGIGIGACQFGLARRDPELIHVLPDAFIFNLEVWVAMHKDLKGVRRMRAMFDHLARELAAYVATSTG